MLATHKTPTLRQCLIDMLFLTLMLGIFYALWMGSYPLFTPDEGRYSEVAREMVATGDYITPRLNGVAFLDKPVLYYWLQASAIHLFGLKEWALRLWPATLGIIGCVITYLAGHILFNRRTGIMAGIILATSPLYYGAAHYANLDLEVAVFISGALLFFLMGMHYIETKWRTVFLILAYGFAAFAFLTKGLIGLAFPMIIVGAWIVLLNQWRLLTRIRLFSGLTLFLILIIPWYYLVQSANPEFLHFFFVKQQVTRFLTKATFNSQVPFWFYVPIVLIGLIPWTIFIIQAICRQVKLIWQNRNLYRNELFLVLWFFTILIFFSIPKSKTVGYILPLFPASALLIAQYLNQCWNNAKVIKNAKLFFIILSFLIAIASFSIPLVAKLDPAVKPYLYFTSVIFLLMGALTSAFFSKINNIKFFTLLTVTATLFLLTIINSTSVINSKSLKPLALQLKAELQPGDEVVTYYRYYQDLPIYLEKRITIVADWHAQDIEYNDNWLREMWYGMPFQDTSDWLIEESTFWQRWNSDHRVFTLINAAAFKNFSQQAQHFRKIAEYNQVLLVSNK